MSEPKKANPRKSEDFVPANHTVVIRLVKEDENKTDTGIIMTTQKDFTEDRPGHGEVFAVSEDLTMNLIPGDYIYFPPATGHDLDILETQEHKYLIIPENMVLGYVKR